MKAFYSFTRVAEFCAPPLRSGTKRRIRAAALLPGRRASQAASLVPKGPYRLGVMIDGGSHDETEYRRCTLRTGRRGICTLLAVLLGLSGLVGCGPAADWVGDTDSSPLDEETTTAPIFRETAGRLYRVALEPRVTPIPPARPHDWDLRIENADGSDFSAERIWIEGGLPAEGIELLLRPRVSPPQGPGQFVVEGVNFHVRGDWVLRVELVGEAGPDRADFEVHVGS